MGYVKDFQIFAKCSQAQLLHYLPMMLREVGYNPVVTKEYIYAEGDLPVALCSHCDIVGNQPPRNFYYDKKQKVIWAGGHILGADDRAGITMIWNIIKQKKYKPHIIFTTDEETIATGADALAALKVAPFKDLHYIIELDRQGEDDCVFYNCTNEDFELYVENFGFTTDFGTFTDISIICPAWGIAGVNLSVGYYNEHTRYEMLNFVHWEKTLHRVEKMLDVAKQSPYFEYVDYYASFGNVKCAFCQQPVPVEAVKYVSSPGHVLTCACPDCIKKMNYIQQCKLCGEYFIATRKKMRYCEDCAEEYGLVE